MSVDKRERRLPSLLVEGNVSSRDGWNEFFRLRYRLKKLKESNPSVYAVLLGKYFGVLDEIKQTLKRARSK